MTNIIYHSLDSGPNKTAILLGPANLVHDGLSSKWTHFVFHARFLEFECAARLFFPQHGLEQEYTAVMLTWE